MSAPSIEQLIGAIHRALDNRRVAPAATARSRTVLSNSCRKTDGPSAE